jgi:hypothetical protein
VKGVFGRRRGRLNGMGFGLGGRFEGGGMGGGVYVGEEGKVNVMVMIALSLFYSVVSKT